MYRFAVVRALVACAFVRVAFSLSVLFILIWFAKKVCPTKRVKRTDIKVRNR